MKSHDTLVLYTDGAAKGNPGDAGIGIVLCDEDGNEIKGLYKYIGQATNNVAEYSALIYGLIEALVTHVSIVRVYSDSELMVRQINRIYAVKNETLRHFYGIADYLIRQFKSFSIDYIPREQNTRADSLANAAIQKRSEGAG